MRVTSLLLAVVSSSLVACGGGSPPRVGGGGAGGPSSSSAPSPTPTSAMGATPYTAEQIREASRRGRIVELRVEAAGKPPVRRVMTFVRVDEQGAEVATVTLDASGAPIDGPKVTQPSWEELRKHAEFPRDATTVGAETITVPAGTFECAVYEVRDGNEVSRYWFAKTLPGPPVQWIVERTGARVLTVTLLANHPGG